jgi:protein-tyrosine phosphatase
MLGLEVQRVPLLDFDQEDQRQHLPHAVSALARLLASGHIVYLHCNAGTGRSPLVAMAYLHWYRKMGRKQAIKHVRDRRFSAPYEDLLKDGPKAGKP